MTPIRYLSIESTCPHRADIERGLHGIELKLCARHLRTVRHHRALHNRTEQLGARRIFERFEAAAECIDQTVACGFVREIRFDFVLGHVVDDVDKHLIGLGADVGDACGHCLTVRIKNGSQRFVVNSGLERG